MVQRDTPNISAILVRVNPNPRGSFSNSAEMLNAGLLGSILVSLGQIFCATVVGDNDTLAKHCCIAQKTSLKDDERPRKISLSAVSIIDLESLSEGSKLTV